MVVTWTTFDPAESLVVFGQAPGKTLPHKASGNATRFVDGGSLGRAMFIHRVTLRGLLPGQSYGKGWGHLVLRRALARSHPLLPVAASRGCTVHIRGHEEKPRGSEVGGDTGSPCLAPIHLVTIPSDNSPEKRDL